MSATPAPPPPPAGGPGTEASWWRTSLIDALGQAVIAMDLGGHVMYWNPAAERLYGWTAAEALGQRLHELIVPETLWSESEGIVARLRRGLPWSGEFEVQRRGGHRFPALVTCTPVTDGDGELVAMVGVATDLTERARMEKANAELAALVTASGDAIVGTELDGTVRSWNAAAERLYAVSADQACGRRLTSLIGGSGRVLAGVRRRLRGAGTVRGHRYDTTDPDGALLIVSVSAAAVMSDGVAVAIAWVLQDVTASTLAERDLAVSESRFHRVFDHSPVGEFLVGTDGTIVAANVAANRMLGSDATGLVGTPLWSWIHPRDRLAVLVSFDTLLDEGRVLEPIECRLLGPDQRLVVVRASGVPLRDRAGTVELALVNLHDITGEKEARRRAADLVREMRSLAVTDRLTGLPNRRLLDIHLRRSLAELDGTGSVSVLFMDLDRFKVVNDSLSHVSGDELLRVVGARIRSAVRPEDTVGRFGGDEFVAILRAVTSHDEAATIADRVLEAVRQPLRIRGYDVTPSVSIGISSTSDPTTKPAELLSEADAAMYRVKQQGGGGFQHCPRGMRREMAARLAREIALRHAVEHRELAVYYQPIVRRGGEIAAVEALVRWPQPATEAGSGTIGGMGEVLGAAAFVGLAEETGLVVPMGDWVLRTACAQVARWRAEVAPDLTVSVNVAAAQLMRPDWVETVLEAVAAGGLPADALTLEVTESALLSHPDLAVKSLERLRAEGFHVALDDFGTGYSSLAYLRHFPVDVLKLDRQFITSLPHHDKDTAIVRSVVEMAHALGIRTVAEGVEESDQAHLLDRLGCDLFQGYLWSPAVGADEMAALLAAARIERS